MSSWIRTSEQMPKHEGRYLVRYRWKGRGEPKTFISDWMIPEESWNGLTSEYEITHWMPLPEPPAHD